MDLASSDINLYKLADAYNPGTWSWFVTRFTLPCPVACHVLKHVGLCDHTFSGLRRSPFDFGSSVSLSTLRLLCYRRTRKTCYVVVLVSPSTTGLSPARLMQLLAALRIRVQIGLLLFKISYNPCYIRVSGVFYKNDFEIKLKKIRLRIPMAHFVL